MRELLGYCLQGRAGADNKGREDAAAFYASTKRAVALRGAQRMSAPVRRRIWYFGFLEGHRDLEAVT